MGGVCRATSTAISKRFLASGRISSSRFWAGVFGMGRTPKIRQVKIPIHGPVDHNGPLQVAVGGLIIAWANNESVFQAMFKSFVSGGDDTAFILWYSHRSSHARLELLDRLVREQIKDAVLVSDIQTAIKKFNGLTGARNFYCHCTYDYGVDRRIRGVQGLGVTQEGAPLRAEYKKVAPALFNEICFVTGELIKQNRPIWELVSRVQNALGTQRVTLPPQFQKSPPSTDGRPLIEGGEKPPEQPPTSRE
jgi:hypothetical protein